MKKKDSSGGGGFVFLILVIAIVALLIGKCGLFPGSGLGILPGKGDNENVSRVANADEEIQEKSDDENIPSVIIVSIKEDEVTINGHLVNNAQELRKYVEEYNTDYRTFELEEEHSLLEAYNWVKEVFDSLDIQLKNSN